MKRIVDYTLISLILITVICVTVLFAQEVRNNVWDNVENIQAKWGKIKSKAEIKKSKLEVLVETEVDIDHPNEKRGWAEWDGIWHYAYARASAGWQWGTFGTYDIEAKADDDKDRDGDDYVIWTWKSERAKDFSSWRKIQGNPDNFPRDANGNAKDLDDYNADDVRSELRKCDADGEIDRIVPGAGGGGNANPNNAMAQTSGGCDSGGCDSGGCNDGYYKAKASID